MRVAQEQLFPEVPDYRRVVRHTRNQTVQLVQNNVFAVRMRRAHEGAELKTCFNLLLDDLELFFERGR